MTNLADNSMTASGTLSASPTVWSAVYSSQLLTYGWGHYSWAFRMYNSLAIAYMSTRQRIAFSVVWNSWKSKAHSECEHIISRHKNLFQDIQETFQLEIRYINKTHNGETIACIYNFTPYYQAIRPVFWSLYWTAACITFPRTWYTPTWYCVAYLCCVGLFCYVVS